MSGVATLKLRGAKRHFDEMAVDLPLQPQGCSPARFVIRQPPLKRGRCNPASSATVSRALKHVASAHQNDHQTNGSGSTAHGGSSNTGLSSNSTSTPLPGLSEEEYTALAKHVPKRLKRVVEKVASGELSSGHRLFTVADLRVIVTSVLAEREAKLGEDFAKVLQDRLAEQFRDFTKFNEDYVTRQLRGTDFAYLS